MQTRGVAQMRLVLQIMLTLMTANLCFGQAPDEVLDIFDERCAFSGCHVGPNAPNGLDLTENFAAASLIEQPSRDFGDEYLRIDPMNPARSYLIMKLRGDAKIKGERMPNGGAPLTDAEVATIENWINSIPKGSKTDVPQQQFAEAFPGLSLATLPTAETLESGFFSYRIAHRWRGEVIDGGFADFFGLDGGARMLTQMTFAPGNNFNFSAGRTSENATFEFLAKWRALRQTNDGSMPISLALVAGVDWATRKQLTGVVEEISRTGSERFHWVAQAAISKAFSDRISVLLVPGVLINGNVQVEDEAALVTLGYAVKFMLLDGMSVFVEGAPILAGAEDAAVVEGARLEDTDFVFNDSFTIGLEKRVGGHVFHVYVTNSIGLSTNQYMSGGNLDFSEGKFRLGFNIYRTIRLPF